MRSKQRCTLQWEAITRRLTNNSKVYSCGSSLSGVLAHGPETNLCVAFTSIEFPFSAQVAQVSATQNHSSFVLQSGEVLTCRDNSLHFCGHLYTNRPIFRPKFVEALKGTPCCCGAAPHCVSIKGRACVYMWIKHTTPWP
ncbi:Regulator of chromosome condensation 1/beta-lactamase-inhibitor protein II protein [Raphanus sativus]|nr:Regulator of chromosome condensation 1/beta-lactamase-inhibitor protein II protein [Raphanus sativus]